MSSLLLNTRTNSSHFFRSIYPFLLIFSFSCGEKKSDNPVRNYDKIENISISDSSQKEEHVTTEDKLHLTSDSIDILTFEKKYTPAADDKYDSLCMQWQLTKDQIKFIFLRSKKITPEEKQLLYYYLPCEMQGELRCNGVIYRYRVNAASFIVLFNKDTAMYFGNEDKNMEKYFILHPGIE
ncbi:MAG: hypothetical protein HZA79_04320 [Sphingobacteriales bacterium]|nr:hypothetical protein [Sphingobacteriales bacterium]